MACSLRSEAAGRVPPQHLGGTLRDLRSSPGPSFGSAMASYKPVVIPAVPKLGEKITQDTLYWRGYKVGRAPGPGQRCSPSVSAGLQLAPRAPCAGRAALVALGDSAPAFAAGAVCIPGWASSRPGCPEVFLTASVGVIEVF